MNSVPIQSPDAGPRIESVSLDKVAVRFDVPDALQLQLVAKMEATAPYYQGEAQSYDHSIRLPLHDTKRKHLDSSRATEMQIFAGPRQSHGRFGRLEFNPGRVDPAIPMLHLETMFGLPWALIQRGYVSDLHIAVDIAHAPTPDLLLYAPKFRVTRRISNAGGVEYIGTTTSRRSFRCYDRAEEIRQHNKRIPDSLRLPVPQHPTTRIAMRLKPGTTVNELCSIRNPFADLTVSTIPTGQTLDWGLRLAFELARCQDINRVLTMLPDEPRDRFVTELRDCSGTWWNSNQIWIEYQGLAGYMSDPAPTKVA